VQILVGEADDAEAPLLEVGVAVAVAAKGGAGAMVPVAVDLDDQAVVEPQGVGVDGAPGDIEGAVDQRGGHLRLAAQVQEESLVVALGVDVGAVGVQRRA